MMEWWNGEMKKEGWSETRHITRLSVYVVVKNYIKSTCNNNTVFLYHKHKGMVNVYRRIPWAYLLLCDCLSLLLAFITVKIPRVVGFYV